MPSVPNRGRFAVLPWPPRPGVALGLLCLVLGGAIAFEAVALFGEESEAPGAGGARPGGMGEILPDDTALTGVVLARPLFTPGRQAAPPAPVAGQAGAEGLRWRLAGILVTSSRREAFFVLGEQRLIAGEGADIEGWKIMSVQAEGVTLARGGMSRTIWPVSAGAGTPAPALRPPPNPGLPTPGLPNAAPPPLLVPAGPEAGGNVGRDDMRRSGKR